MRYLASLACVLALIASPLSVSAQGEDENGSRLEEWHPEAFAQPSKPNTDGLEWDLWAPQPAPEEPALRLEVDPAGVEVAPGYPARAPVGYTLKEMELRVKRARIGLGVSGVVFLVGSTMGIVALAKAEPFCLFDCPPPPQWVEPVGWAGVFFMSAGFVGMVTSAVIMRGRKRQLRGLEAKPHHETPRRVRWDLAQSRLVF